MDEIWKKLPTDIVNVILEHDRTIRYRNGKYMNQILNPDKTYKLLYERMYFDKNRYDGFSSLVINGIHQTAKTFLYRAHSYGLSVFFYYRSVENNFEVKELYTNITDAENKIGVGK